MNEYEKYNVRTCTCLIFLFTSKEDVVKFNWGKKSDWSAIYYVFISN